MSYQLPPASAISPRAMPLRQAPLPPTSTGLQAATGTLSHYHNDFLGIPFVLNPRLRKLDTAVDIPKFSARTDALDYDFQLERQVLCYTRSENRKSASTNPFF